MNAAIWIGLILDVALLVWLINSVNEIKRSNNEIGASIPEVKAYLRRIALSLSVSPEQMRVINASITTEEAMVLFEKAGGSIMHLRRPGLPTAVLFHVARYSGEPEILQLLKDNESKVLEVLNGRAANAADNTEDGWPS